MWRILSLLFLVNTIRPELLKVYFNVSLYIVGYRKVGFTFAIWVFLSFPCIFYSDALLSHCIVPVNIHFFLEKAEAVGGYCSSVVECSTIPSYLVPWSKCICDQVKVIFNQKINVYILCLNWMKANVWNIMFWNLNRANIPMYSTSFLLHVCLSKWFSSLNMTINVLIIFQLTPVII